MATLNAHPHKPHLQLLMLAVAVTAVVWEVQGNLEAALAAAALVLQLIEMMRVEPL